MAFGIEDNWMGSAYTDENGQAWLTLPEGDYRFGVYIAPDWFYSSEQAD